MSITVATIEIEGFEGHVAFFIKETGEVLIPLRHFERKSQLPKRRHSFPYRNQTTPELMKQFCVVGSDAGIVSKNAVQLSTYRLEDVLKVYPDSEWLKTIVNVKPVAVAAVAAPEQQKRERSASLSLDEIRQVVKEELRAHDEASIRLEFEKRYESMEEDYERVKHDLKRLKTELGALLKIE